MKFTGDLQKFLNKGYINFPFLSLGASLANIVEKIINYVNAVKAKNLDLEDVKNKKEKKANPALELKKQLAMFEMIDELLDGAENVVTTILKFFVALTAGFSAIINTSINIFIAILHIGVAAFKLHAISKLKTDIEEYYNEKIKGMSVEFEAFKKKLYNLECNHLITLWPKKYLIEK